MATANANLSYLVTGKLAYGCTDLDTAFPHGGTALGNAGSVVFFPPDGVIALPGCESNTSEALLYVGGDAVLTCELESWDDDALSAILESTTTNSEEIVSWPLATTVEGEKVASLGNLVFSPTNQAHPGLVLYAARPHLQASEGMRLSARFFLSVPMAFLGVPDGSGRVAKMGTFTELTL